MEALIEGEYELDLSGDIDRLLILREIESELKTLDGLSEKTSNLWIGLETPREKMSSALALQRIISLAIEEERWSEEGPSSD